MTGFMVILDDLGIETSGGSIMGRSQVILPNAKGKLETRGAIAVRAVSVDSTTSGTLKGAAWGLIIAGPLGAAIGSMVGGGMKVAFEIDTLEGETLKCIAGKGAYLEIKKRVESRPAQPKALKAPREKQTGPRRVHWLLMIAIFVLPLFFAWFLMLPRFTMRARIIAFAWMVVWCAAYAAMPKPPAEEAAAPAEAAAAIEP